MAISDLIPSTVFRSNLRIDVRKHTLHRSDHLSYEVIPALMTLHQSHVVPNCSGMRQGITTVLTGPSLPSFPQRSHNTAAAFSAPFSASSHLINNHAPGKRHWSIGPWWSSCLCVGDYRTAATWFGVVRVFMPHCQHNLSPPGLQSYILTPRSTSMAKEACSFLSC